MSDGTRSGVNWMPGEVAADHGREAAHRQRLGHAGHALEQDVALGQQADHQLLDHVLLADDDPLDLGDRLAEQLGGLLVARLPGGRAGRLAGRRAVRRTAHAVLLIARPTCWPAREPGLSCAIGGGHSRRPRGPAYWLPQGHPGRSSGGDRQRTRLDSRDLRRVRRPARPAPAAAEMEADVDA